MQPDTDPHIKGATGLELSASLFVQSTQPPPPNPPNPRHRHAGRSAPVPASARVPGLSANQHNASLLSGNKRCVRPQPDRNDSADGKRNEIDSTHACRY